VEVVSKKEPSCCDICGATSTPLWRQIRGKSTCNACGLRHKRHGSFSFRKRIKGGSKPKQGAVKKRAPRGHPGAILAEAGTTRLRARRCPVPGKVCEEPRLTTKAATTVGGRARKRKKDAVKVDTIEEVVPAADAAQTWNGNGGGLLAAEPIITNCPSDLALLPWLASASETRSLLGLPCSFDPRASRPVGPESSGEGALSQNPRDAGKAVDAAQALVEDEDAGALSDSESCETISPYNSKIRKYTRGDDDQGIGVETNVDHLAAGTLEARDDLSFMRQLGMPPPQYHHHYGGALQYFPGVYSAPPAGFVALPPARCTFAAATQTKSCSLYMSLQTRYNTCKTNVRSRLLEELRSITVALQRIDEEIIRRKEAYDNEILTHVESVPVPLPLVFSFPPLSSSTYYF